MRKLRHPPLMVFLGADGTNSPWAILKAGKLVRTGEQSKVLAPEYRAELWSFVGFRISGLRRSGLGVRVYLRHKVGRGPAAAQNSFQSLGQSPCPAAKSRAKLSIGCCIGQVDTLFFS